MFLLYPLKNGNSEYAAFYGNLQQPHFPIMPLKTWQFRICRILWKFALLRDEGMTWQTLERDTSGNSQVSTELCGFSLM